MKTLITFFTLALFGSTAKADFSLATLSTAAPSLGAAFTGMRAQKKNQAEPHYQRGSGQTQQKENDKQIAGMEAKNESDIGSEYSQQAAGLYSQGSAIAAAKMDFASAQILSGCAQTMAMQKAQDDDASRKNRLVEEKARQADPNSGGANFYTVQVIKLGE